jgi:hypothetical protein
LERQERLNHYSQTVSVKQTQRRQQSEAREHYERQRREQRVRMMNAAVEQSLRQQAALRRLGW